MTDSDLLRQFEDQSLPFDQWVHRTHVKVAWIYLNAHPLEDAIDRMRTGIKAYNAAHSVPEGPAMGYHETITQFFMRIIDLTMREYGRAMPSQTADEFCDTHPHLMAKKLTRLFIRQSTSCSRRRRNGTVRRIYGNRDDRCVALTFCVERQNVTAS